MDNQFKVEWQDYGREPSCAPNPDYPEGKDIKLIQHPDIKYCTAALPYPAKRIGLYVVECARCGVKVGVTTAGRPDDPRSVQILCKELLH